MNQPYIYIYPLHFGFPSHLGYHSALSRVQISYIKMDVWNLEKWLKKHDDDVELLRILI